MIDILYLGCNMGNCVENRRFFCRYPGAEKDYYDTFRWLVKFKGKYPEHTIAIKHHPGHYSNDRDKKENSIIEGSNIYYLNNQEDSYALAEEARMVVCYVTTMILELRGYPNLAKMIKRKQWHNKKQYIRRPCKGNMPNYRCVAHPHAYYLDPNHRNKQFCAYIDDVCKHDCSRCKEVPYLEIYEPWRLTTYKHFERRALCILEK